MELDDVLYRTVWVQSLPAHHVLIEATNDFCQLSICLIGDIYIIEDHGIVVQADVEEPQLCFDERVHACRVAEGETCHAEGLEEGDGLEKEHRVEDRQGKLDVAEMAWAVGIEKIARLASLALPWPEHTVVQTT